MTMAGRLNDVATNGNCAFSAGDGFVRDPDSADPATGFEIPQAVERAGLIEDVHVVAVGVNQNDVDEVGANSL